MSRFRRATKAQSRLRLALVGPSGSGKAQPLHSKILTPSGWVRMGEVNVGDTVIDCDGREQKVTGVYPQGMKSIYEVFFSDGTSAQCCKEHLWFTQTVADRAAKRPGSVKSLAEIANTLHDKHGKRNHYIPLTQPVRFPSEGFRPIDPYLLGLLIGDGMLGENCTHFSNPEPELQEAFAGALPSGTELYAAAKDGLNFTVRRIATHGANPLLDSLRLLGLAGHKSIEKFIPESYLFGPFEARLALLQGLLDTDGYAGGYTVEYSTSSQQLAEDFRFLVQSLGGTATLSSRIPRYSHKGERRTGAVSYRLYVSLPSHIKPFRLKRKADRYIPRTKYLPHRKIERIEYVGEMDAQCIAVSSPDQLYLTDHCIVTHNTYTALAIASGLGSRIAVIDTEHGSASKYADLWDFDVMELGVFDPRIYVEAIQAAEAEGYEVIIVDSLSHAWMGRGGVLELADNAKDRYRGNSFAGWKDATPLHNALIDAIVRCKCHLIATMRSKTEYVLQQGPKGVEPVKIGMAPIQRDGMDFEFDVAADMTTSHKMIVTKTRCRALDSAVIDRPGRDVAEILRGWLSDGAPAAQAATPALIPAGTVAELTDLIGKVGMSPEQVRAMLTKRGVTAIESLTPSDAEGIINRLKHQLGLFPFQQAGDSPNPAVASPGADQSAAEMQRTPGQAGDANSLGGFGEATAAAAGEPEAATRAAGDDAVSGQDTTDEAASDAGGPEGDGSADDYVIGDATRPDRPEKHRPRRGRKDAGATAPAAT